MSAVERHHAAVAANNKSDFPFSKSYSYPSNSFQNIFRRQYPRRTVLKRAAQFATAFAIAPFSSIQIDYRSEEPSEVAPRTISNTAFIDFTPEQLTKGILQEDYVNLPELEKTLLGNEFPSDQPELLEKISGSTPESLETYLLSNYTSLALFHGCMDRFAHHGEIVADTHKKTLNQFHYETEPFMISIQKSYTPESLDTNYTDRLGNQGISINTKADSFIDKVASRTERAVSMSFQLGRLKAIYAKEKYVYTLNNSIFTQVITEYNKSERSDEGIASHYPSEVLKDAYIKALQAEKISTSEVIIHGAGTGEDAMSNLLELIKLAESDKDKLFIVAAGNYNDDWRDVREKLKNVWPENVLIVGQWNRNKNSPDGIVGQINGADIYIDNEDFSFIQNIRHSSISTAIVSALANILFDKGCSLKQVKNILSQSCDPIEYSINDENLKLYDFPNIQALAEYYVTKPKAIAQLLNRAKIADLIHKLKNGVCVDPY